MKTKLIKFIKENDIIVITLLVLVTIMFGSILLNSGREVPLGGRSGGGGDVSANSIIRATTGSYNSYVIRSGSSYLERIVIGNSVSNAGILIDDSITTHSDNTRKVEVYGAPIGSIEIGAPFDIGILITTSPELNASFIYRPF